MLAYAVFTLRKRESVILVFGATLVPLCLYAVYQLLTSSFGPFWEWLYPHMLDQPWTGRAYSFFWWPNAFGYFCSTVTIMLLVLAVAGYRRTLCLLFAVSGIIGLILSGSRGAIVGLAISCLVLALVESKMAERFLLVAIPASLVALALLSTDIAVFERPEESTSTIDSRMVVWGGALLAFSQNPAIGVGSTNLTFTMADFADKELSHAHDVYLQMLAENGVIGFTLFFGPLAYLLWRSWNGKRDRVLLASSLALLVFLGHGLTDNVLMPDNPQCLLLFFCVIGLAATVPTPSMRDGQGAFYG